ncbi:PP2C family protein-serine/threonine phosphatase [Paraoerskovia sediminicola]|uniref:PP2C family protein-serine/threonine phosphatase n=1 Tax=Paraoerskovia sediminicola TaxID=1138587 RepID=UPI002572F01B|nr:PP2C family protein-serine/threonine phosphatase [Paraoerskovia sediminicola]
MIGDVAGHGPDEAALGATLRTAWRTLVVTGTPPERVIGQVEQVLLVERARPEVFATLCQLVIAPDRRSADIYLAGHPAPLMLDGESSAEAPSHCRGRAIGVPVDGGWPACSVDLGSSWAVLLHTDGLVEATVRPDLVPGSADPDGRRERVGAQGLLAVVDEVRAQGSTGVVERILRRVRDLHGGPLTDDAAVLMIGGSDTLTAGERGATLADSEAWSS